MCGRELRKREKETKASKANEGRGMEEKGGRKRSLSLSHFPNCVSNTGAVLKDSGREGKQ